MRRKLQCFILFLIYSYGLTACIPVAFVIGAGAGGAIIYDKRGVKSMVQDRDIANEAWKRINYDSQLKDEARISVASFNHLVLLVGQAPTEALKTRAYNLVSSIPHVKRIYNEVTIGPPISAVEQTHDAWITTKVKSAMLAVKGLKSSQIKIVTENHIVYLMGIVTRKQANLTAEAASKILGVDKVVKIFEYEQ